MTSVGTNAPVIVAGNILTIIIILPIRHSPLLFISEETELDMSPITERLVGRWATSTQGHDRFGIDRLPSRVLEILEILHKVGAISCCFYQWFFYAEFSLFDSSVIVISYYYMISPLINYETPVYSSVENFNYQGLNPPKQNYPKYK